MRTKKVKASSFNFLLSSGFLGYNSASDKTTLDLRFMIRGAKNVYIKPTGTIATRPGKMLRGSSDSTLAGVTSSFEWDTTLGTVRNIRVCNGKVQVESDIAASGTYVWYELFQTATLASLAASFTRFVFDTWWDNDDRTDRLVFVRGDSNIFYWSGAMAKVLSSTADTITVDSASTWAQLGFALTIAGEKKIMIDGREATYTGGEGTSTLTGVTMSTGDASTIAVGAIAIQSVLVQPGGATKMFPSTYNADMVRIVGNQSLIGSYSSREVYMSADSTVGGVLGFLNYENTGGHVYGDPDLIVLDSPCKAIGEKDGTIAIFAGKSELYLISPNTNVTYTYTGSDGAARFIYNKVEKRRLAGLTSALGHEFVDNFGEYLVWIDQKNQLRALGSFAGNNNTLKPALWSLDVQQELSEDDFTGGHLRSTVDTIYITAPPNGRDWMFQVFETIDSQGQIISKRIWHPPQVRAVSRFALIDGEVFGHSSVYPQVYQIWNTGLDEDDAPGDVTAPYTCVARFPYHSYVANGGRSAFNMIYVEGYMPEETPLLMNVYIEYQGSKALQTLVIDAAGDEAKFFGGLIPSLGDSSLGDNPLGQGIIPEGSDQELIPKFRAIPNLNEVNCFESSLEFYSVDPARWELLRFGPNVHTVSEKPTFLRK